MSFIALVNVVTCAIIKVNSRTKEAEQSFFLFCAYSNPQADGVLLHFQATKGVLSLRRYSVLYL